MKRSEFRDEIKAFLDKNIEYSDGFRGILADDLMILIFKKLNALPPKRIKLINKKLKEVTVRYKLMVPEWDSE